MGDDSVVSLRVGVFGAPGIGKSALVSSLFSKHHVKRRRFRAAKNRRRINIQDADADDDFAEEQEKDQANHAVEWEVVLPLGGGCRAKMVVVDVPGALCVPDAFYETPDDILEKQEEEEKEDENDDSSSDKDDGSVLLTTIGKGDGDGDETKNKKKEKKKEAKSLVMGNDQEKTILDDSAASIAMICDSFVVCYDPCLPETVDFVSDLIRLLEAQKDPLPLHGVLCATRNDRTDAPNVAKQRTIDDAKQIAEKYDFAHAVTASIKGGSGVDACFRSAVCQAQKSLRTDSGVAAQQCCQDLFCSCAIC